MTRIVAALAIGACAAIWASRGSQVPSVRDAGSSRECDDRPPMDLRSVGGRDSPRIITDPQSIPAIERAVLDAILSGPNPGTWPAGSRPAGYRGSPRAYAIGHATHTEDQLVDLIRKAPSFTSQERSALYSRIRVEPRLAYASALIRTATASPEMSADGSRLTACLAGLADRLATDARRLGAHPQTTRDVVHREVESLCRLAIALDAERLRRDAFVRNGRDWRAAGDRLESMRSAWPGLLLDGSVARDLALLRSELHADMLAVLNPAIPGNLVAEMLEGAQHLAGDETVVVSLRLLLDFGSVIAKCPAAPAADRPNALRSLTSICLVVATESVADQVLTALSIDRTDGDARCLRVAAQVLSHLKESDRWPQSIRLRAKAILETLNLNGVR